MLYGVDDLLRLKPWPTAQAFIIPDFTQRWGSAIVKFD